VNVRALSLLLLLSGSFAIGAETSGCATIASRCFASRVDVVAATYCQDEERRSFCLCDDNRVYVCVSGRAVNSGTSCSGDVQRDEQMTLDQAPKAGTATTNTRIAKLPEDRVRIQYAATASNAQMKVVALDAAGRLTTGFGSGAFLPDRFDIYRRGQTLPLFSRAIGTPLDGCGVLKSDGTLLCWTNTYRGMPDQVSIFRLGKAARGRKVVDLRSDGCWTDGEQARCEGDSEDLLLQQRNTALSRVGVRKFVDPSGAAFKFIDRDGVLRACGNVESGEYRCDVVAAAAALRLVAVSGDCGLDESNKLVCWGTLTAEQGPVGPVGAPTTGEQGRLCAIDNGDGGSPKCWRSDDGATFGPVELGALPRNLVDLSVYTESNHGMELLGLDESGNAHAFSFTQPSGFTTHTLSTFPLPALTCVYPKAPDGTTTCGSVELAADADRRKFETGCADAGGALANQNCAERVSEPLRWHRAAPTAEEDQRLSAYGPAISYWVFGPLTGSSEQRCGVGEYSTTETSSGTCFP